MPLRAGLNKWRQRSGRERRLLLEAFAWLGLMRAAISLFPFRWFLRWLRLERSADAPGCAESVDPRIAEIGWAISAAAARTPWRSTCLVKAFCGAHMLGRRRIPCTLRFGVAKGKDGRDLLNAHAWLSCDERIVTGKRDSERFTTLAAFRRRARR